MAQTKTQSHNENGEIKKMQPQQHSMQHGTGNSTEAVRPQNERMGATRELNGQRQAWEEERKRKEREKEEKRKRERKSEVGRRSGAAVTGPGLDRIGQCAIYSLSIAQE